MNLTVTESSNVIVKEGDLSSEMVNFASGRTGTYSMSGTDAALFNVVTAADGSTTFETQDTLNFVATDSNSYSFAITFTDGTTGETFTDELTMAVVDNTSAATVKASRSTLSVSNPKVSGSMQSIPLWIQQMRQTILAMEFYQQAYSHL